MQERTYEIKNKLGLHARPTALFVQVTSKYQSSIRVTKDDQEVDGKSIMGLLTLAAEQGSFLKIVADGPDENEVLDKLAETIESFPKEFNEY
jgi:phosphocarrier protein